MIRSSNPPPDVALEDPRLRERCPALYPEAYPQAPGHWARCFAVEGRG